jgi:hypothetical protein
MKYLTQITVLFVTFVLVIMIAGCDTSNTESKDAGQSAPGTAKAVSYKEIDWEDLVPEGYRPDEVLEEYMTEYKLDELEDYDPIVVELQAKLKELLASAPVDEKLNGQSVKLPGYLLPLDSDGETTSEFLLVPYFGACIHVPPPPANQTIYVKSSQPVKTEGLFDPVWVSGKIIVEHKVSEYADSGYTMMAQLVEEYQIPEEEAPYESYFGE